MHHHFHYNICAWYVNVYNFFEIILTPSFHPRIGMNATTLKATKEIVSVARRPTMKFIVATIRIGSATAKPMMMP